MPKNLSSDALLPLKCNRENLRDSNIMKVISKKLVRKAIEMLHNLAERDESKEEKDDYIDDKTKEVKINVNGEVKMNNAPPPQDALTTTTTLAATTKEGRDNDNNDEVGNTKTETTNTTTTMTKMTIKRTSWTF